MFFYSPISMEDTVSLGMATTARSIKTKHSTSSAKIIEFPCGPCKAANRNQEAFGYCKFCKQYLCKSCYNYHHNLGKIHILLDREAMPRDTPTPITDADPLTEACQEHRHKTIELYCKNHDEVCCVICTTSKHKTCECFYIPDYTKNLTNSPAEECEQILKLIQALVKQFENIRSESNKKLKDLDRQKREFTMAVKKYRKEIDIALDQLEKQVVSGMKQVVDINTKDLNDNISKCEESIQALNQTRADAETAVESSGINRVFTLSKTSNKCLQENSVVMKKVTDNSISIEVKFDENYEILKNIRRTKTFGKVTVTREPMKFNGEGQQDNDKNKSGKQDTTPRSNSAKSQTLT